MTTANLCFLLAFSHVPWEGGGSQETQGDHKSLGSLVGTSRRTPSLSLHKIAQVEPEAETLWKAS